MAPPSRMATRRAEGEMATFPPPSRTGLARAVSSVFPEVASYTSTSCPLMSSKEIGENASTACVDSRVSRARRNPLGAMIRRGQICVGGLLAFHSRLPSVDIATIQRLPSGLHVVTRTSGSETNSTDGAHTESIFPTTRSPPLKYLRMNTHSYPLPRSVSTYPSELIGK